MAMQAISARYRFTFVSSIMAAVSLPNLWLGLRGEFAALTGGALNLGIAFTGISIYMLQDYNDTDEDRSADQRDRDGNRGDDSAVLVAWAWRLPV